ncbi:MAG: hypothetical protein M3Y49_20350 [Actinomycetota bacterium]|nr:hypothetical protein [Actinomycetota bacterium]
MTTLANAVLPLIRTRADLHRWSASNAHGAQIYDAIDILEATIPTADPRDAYQVTQKALASALKVIMRADDSSGIIGDACRRLLELHPVVAAVAAVPAGKLIDWMFKFQFEGEVDFFTLDPVAYAPALGEAGVTRRGRRCGLPGTAAGAPGRSRFRAVRRWSLGFDAVARPFHSGVECAATRSPGPGH